MVNTDDFIKRLEIILEYYSINASAFADKIGVQRSSLSHLLSGRNKPSLDFVLKILEVYPEIDLYWILNGKGSFPKNDNNPTTSETILEKPTLSTPEVVNRAPKEDFISKNAVENKSETIKELFDNTIEKIVFFYKDGTFKTFNPNNKK
ncbi:MAG: helix-turn-helix transcriptional regulator [Flavobacterium sp.]